MADEQQFFKDPNALDYFVKNFLMGLPAARVPYLEGWSYNPADPNYDYRKAMLTGVTPHPVMQDMGDWGPSPHWGSTTPQGDWLKAPWHKTAHMQTEAVMGQTFQDLLRKIAGMPAPQ